MTPEKDLVEEARELLAQITPWPWEAVQGDRCWHVRSQDRTFETGCIMFAGGEGSGKGNASLIARTPELLSKFIATVDQLREDKKLLGERLEAQAKESVDVVAERDALRDACQQFVHWYAEDSTEFNRDSAYDAAVAVLTPKG